MTWRQVALAAVASQRKHFITIDDDANYKRCRVQTGARGVVLRDIVPGSEIKTKKQQPCRAGDFLVAEIDAKAGGYGLVPDDLEGAVVSSHYFLFEIDKSAIDPAYLAWFAKTDAFFQQVRAVGSTNYAAVRPASILRYMIPLAPLTEQRRIVARLDAAAEAMAARIDAASELEAELAATLAAVFDRITKNAPRSTMGEVAPLVRRPVTIDPDATYPELGVRSFGKGTFHKPPLAGIDVGSKKLFSIEPADLVFNIVFAWEGAVAVAEASDVGRVGSHRFLSCVPDPSSATATFLRYWFLSEEGLLALGRASPGGAGRNRTLGIKGLEAIRVPVPPLDAQHWFDRLQSKVRAARMAQASATAELEALLPALLHNAFGGADARN